MDKGLRVLVIEDQHDIAANIWDFLERRGHEVDHCADGESGLARALSGGFDVVVLDIGLPRLDGLQLCQRLRLAGNNVPVLMLTARDTLPDKLLGFAGGADDYLVKPFALPELEARIRVVARRGVPLREPWPALGDLSYHAAARTAWRGGRAIPLTAAQGSLLATLMRDFPGVTTHRKLMRAVWGEDGGDAAALHTHIYELRQLIDVPPAASLIQSVRGSGYRLVATG